LLPSLSTVLAQTSTVEVALASLVHHAEKSTVECEVVTIVREEVVAGERSVALEFVVAILQLSATIL